MGSFTFWQRWLLAVALLLVVFGLVIALFNQTGLFGTLFNDQIDPEFWSGGPDAAARDFQQWAYGVLGATVAGWGVFIAFIAAGPFQRCERWAWMCIALGLGLWYVVDTALSLASGVIFNAGINTVLIVLAAAPLIATRRAFFGAGGG